MTRQDPTFGNALPISGTGQVVYAQAEYLLLQNFSLEKKEHLQPYASAILDRLEGENTTTYNTGINCLLSCHAVKVFS